LVVSQLGNPRENKRREPVNMEASVYVETDPIIQRPPERAFHNFHVHFVPHSSGFIEVGPRKPDRKIAN
jgi:hypothetical protein